MERGREKATLKDVAEAAGVHASTVSRALNPDKRNLVNPETREEIERVARELDYRPDKVASSLRRGRTNVIGVVVADLSNPFIGPVLRGIENALGGRGVMPMMVESRDSSDRLAARLRGARRPPRRRHHHDRGPDRRPLDPPQGGQPASRWSLAVRALPKLTCPPSPTTTSWGAGWRPST